MTGIEIRSLIYEKGATLSDIARISGKSHSSITRVINGESRSRDIATMISNFLGKPVDVLWPGKYPNVYRRRSSERVLMELQAAAAHLRAEVA